MDFQRAMEADIPDEIGGHQIMLGHCGRVRRLKCVQVDEANRYQCSYRYDGNRRGIAIIERQEGRFWRWVSGPKKCTVVTES